jgi:hypothetical protein
MPRFESSDLVLKNALNTPTSICNSKICSRLANSRHEGETKGARELSRIVKMKIWQPLWLSVPNFQISRDETLDYKPIIFVQNCVKCTYGNVEFQNYPGRTPAPRGGEGRVEESRGGERRGRGWGVRRERGGGEGLRERKGWKEEKMEEGKGRGFGTPRSSRQIDATAHHQ